MGVLKVKYFEFFDDTGHWHKEPVKVSVTTEGIFVYQLEPELFDLAQKIYKADGYQTLSQEDKCKVGGFRSRGVDKLGVYGNSLSACESFIGRVVTAKYSSTKERSKVILYRVEYTFPGHNTKESAWDTKSLSLSIEAICCEKTVTTNSFGSRTTYDIVCEDHSEADDVIWTEINFQQKKSNFLNHDKTLARYNNIVEMPYNNNTGLFFRNILQSFNSLIERLHKFFCVPEAVAIMIQNPHILLNAFNGKEGEV